MKVAGSYNNSDLITCVIGGAGFIGRSVVNALILRGRKVLVIGRSALKSPLPLGVNYVQILDFSSFESEIILKNILGSVNEIIDLTYATVPKTSFQDPVNDIIVNLPKAVKLFDLASSFPIDKFVWISSGGTVYGKTESSSIIETHTTYPVSPYGITKLAIEKYAHMYFETKGLPIVCVRPSNAFGEQQKPYSGQGFIATAIASIIEERNIVLFGEQGTVRDYLHVSDVANGIVHAMLHGTAGEVYNLGSGVGFSNFQVLNSIKPLAEEMGKEIKFNILPSRSFDVPTNVLNHSKLKNETGWQPMLSFDDALKRTWNWYKENHVCQ